jgi:hypothetical protein
VLAAQSPDEFDEMMAAYIKLYYTGHAGPDKEYHQETLDHEDDHLQAMQDAAIKLQDPYNGLVVQRANFDNPSEEDPVMHSGPITGARYLEITKLGLAAMTLAPLRPSRSDKDAALIGLKYWDRQEVIERGLQHNADNDRQLPVPRLT